MSNVDLAKLIDVQQSECLNEVAPNSWRTCFGLATVKIQTIKFVAANDGSAPKIVKLWSNKLNIGFDEAESEAATQELQLTQADVSNSAAAQQLKFVKFQNVSKLTIFVMNNQGDVDQTKISRIELSGSSQNSASEASAVHHPHSVAEYDQLKLSSRGKLFVVQFSAEWCGPCKAISPLFAQLARNNESKAVFVHVDAEKLADISDTNDVRAFPTFKFFDKTGNLVHRFEGADSDALQRATAQFTR